MAEPAADERAGGGPAHLVIGGDGLIGGAVTYWLQKRGYRVFATTRRSGPLEKGQLFLDLARDVSDWQLPEPVATVYICVGATGMKTCDEHPKETALVNVHNSIAVARRLHAGGAFVVGLSSSAVFDGSSPVRKVGDAHRPLTEYGRQKSAVERDLLALGKGAAIVRFAKVLSPTLPVFARWLRALAVSQPIQPLTDLTMAPIPLGLIVELVARAGLQRQAGVFQASGAADVSYAEAGCILLRQLGLPADLCQPATSHVLGIDLPPGLRYTTLDMRETEVVFGIAAPPIEETMAYLASFMPEVRNGVAAR